MMKTSIVRGASLMVVIFGASTARADDATRTAPPPTAVDQVMKRPDTPASRLDAAQAAPVDTLRFGGGGAPVDGKTGQLGSVVSGTKAEASAGAGAARAVSTPTADGAASPVLGKPQRRHPHTPKVPDAPRVIEGLTPELAACLTDADASVEGPAVVNATIAETGDVSATTLLTPGGVSTPAAACFRTVVLRAKFAPLARTSELQIRLSPRTLRAMAAIRIARK
jgi:hypothetical protein